MEDLIYCQKQIPKEKWRYGFRSSAAVGCGWIATYNALRLMDYRADPKGLIRYYERQVPLLNGNTGTVFFGPGLYFKKWGFPVTVTADRKQFDDLAKESDVCILFYRWRDKWQLGSHFVTVRCTPDGFVGYNTYRNSKGPDRYGRSLEKFLRNKKYFGAVLISICKPKGAVK